MDVEELTDPCYEQDEFNSIYQALHWKHIRARVPDVNGSSSNDDNTTSTYVGLGQSINTSHLVNRLYISK